MNPLALSLEDPVVAITVISVIALIALYNGYKKWRESRPVRPVHPVVTVPNAGGSVIEHVRNAVGPTPRTFTGELESYVTIRPPSWVGRDELNVQYKHQKRIRENGNVAWATFAQVNSTMFQPGGNDSPASMIYSLDPYYDDRPEELAEIAERLYALKGTKPTDPDTAPFARLLTDELERGMGMQVPLSLTGGRKVYHSAMVFVRKHLPEGHVTFNLMPVWVDPEGTGGLIMVPTAYWPGSLREAWRS